MTTATVRSNRRLVASHSIDRACERGGRELKEDLVALPDHATARSIWLTSRAAGGADRRLERAIATAARLMANATTWPGRRHHQQRWARLLANRSPERIAAMQAELDHRTGLELA